MDDDLSLREQDPAYRATLLSISINWLNAIILPNNSNKKIGSNE